MCSRAQNDQEYIKNEYTGDKRGWGYLESC